MLYQPRRELWTPRHRWDVPLPGHSQPRYYHRIGPRRVILLGGAVPAAVASTNEYNDAVEALSPLRWFKMDEDLADTTIIDSGSTGIDGTEVGSPDPQQSWTSSTDITRAINFVSTEHYDIGDDPDFDDTDTFSIIAWIKPSTDGVIDTILGKLDGATTGWMFYRVGNKLTFQVCNGGSCSAGAADTVFLLDTQNFVGMTHSAGREVTFYLNASADGGYTHSSKSILNDADAQIGTDGRSASGFDGLITQLAIFDTVLSEANMTNLNNLGIAG